MPGRTTALRGNEHGVFDLPTDQQADMWRLVAQVREQLRDAGADAVNVGINDGEAAGQTVMHAQSSTLGRW